ncbi:hypothetical protein [Streptomyces sp. NPDC048248]|uniref:hypothetical protein n=1 Tax=Streptomyces sp. NPDC048248 TaxID=3365523 RepID=UPI00371259C9
MDALAADDKPIAGLRTHGVELVGELEQYQDTYRLRIIHGSVGNIGSRTTPFSDVEPHVVDVGDHSRPDSSARKTVTQHQKTEADAWPIRRTRVRPTVR